jgi:hypothetical protein
MEVLQILIVAFGGSVAALAVAAFLGRSLLSQLLAREMEGLRSRLKTEGDTLLESLKAKLQQDARVEVRGFERAQVMARYEGPLLHAVYDLQSRLYNILANGFFHRYLLRGTPEQQHYAGRNTAFLIAQYFGWTEIIRQEVQFLERNEDDATRSLSVLRDEIYGLWQTDRLADPLMIWAGEQRAIGELMMDARGAQLSCKGYANFLKSFSAGQEPLMDRLQQAVIASASGQGHAHDRLRAIQHKLVELLDALDPTQRRFPSRSRSKV